jgi:hypothetical protein
MERESYFENNSASKAFGLKLLRAVVRGRKQAERKVSYRLVCQEQRHSKPNAVGQRPGGGVSAPASFVK